MRGVIEAVREKMVFILVVVGFLLVGSLINIMIDM